MKLRAFAAQEFIISGIANSIKYEFLEPRGVGLSSQTLARDSEVVLMIVIDVGLRISRNRNSYRHIVLVIASMNSLR